MCELWCRHIHRTPRTPFGYSPRGRHRSFEVAFEKGAGSHRTHGGSENQQKDSQRQGARGLDQEKDVRSMSYFGNVYRDPEPDFWSRVFIPKDPTACWHFTSNRNSFGHARYRGTAAHRYSWAIHNRMVPHPCLVILHDCDNPPCVNPFHLTLGTSKDNSLDCSIRKRRITKKTDVRVWAPCSRCKRLVHYPMPVGNRVLGVSCECFLRSTVRSSPHPPVRWNRDEVPADLESLGIRATPAAMAFLSDRLDSLGDLFNPPASINSRQ